MTTMQPMESDSDGALAIWRRCVSSAFRTALACMIVGGVTLYGPEFINRQVAFPAFSYVTVILLVTDATLGDALRGCWLALYATVLGVCPAILSLWLIGPARLTTGVTAVLVGLSAFVVALPQNTELLTRRIALGQIVIVYVVAFINGGDTKPVMHPVHVAASTAIGVAACVLALLLPYPRLAFSEVKRDCRLYTENASERVKLLVNAFTADNDSVPKGFISRVHFLNIIANKLLQNIQRNKESMQRERSIATMFMKSHGKNRGSRLGSIETVLTGMEIALKNCTGFPIKLMDSELIKNDVVNMKERFLNLVKNVAVEETSIMPHESVAEPYSKKLVQALQTMISTAQIESKDLPSFFFVFCLNLLDISTTPKETTTPDGSNDAKNTKNWLFLTKSWNIRNTIRRLRLKQALGCALALGFSVLFGLMYSKGDGYWAGLPVAISYVAEREATFKAANVKAQGTVLGTVYGVMGCFLFENYVKIRFISLLPWFIFCSFLRTSKMYGPAGGISAVIGAVLILGRDKFGVPDEFAIARIVETFIGLSCSIAVDVLFKPTRAAVLSKSQLRKSLRAVNECVGSISTSESRLEEGWKRLKSHLNQLGKFIEEADAEPNFWFLPFNSACYGRLKASLSRTADFVLFGTFALNFLRQESRNIENDTLKQGVLKFDDELEALKDMVRWRMRALEKVVSVKSLSQLENELGKRQERFDLEMGKSENACRVGRLPGFGAGEVEEITNSLLRHLNEDVISKEAILSVSCLIFCMKGVLKECEEMEKGISELMQWENPSRQVDLHGIVCKMHTLGTCNILNDS